MTYESLCAELSSLADGDYRAFHSRLLAKDGIRLFGVRMPVLRKLAKQYAAEWETVLFFPDEWYEVTLLKCLVLGQQSYPVFLENLPKILPHIDNWATCDCFDAPCIARNRAHFLSFLERNRFSPHEFTSRWCLVSLLRYYCTEEYYPFLFASAEGCDHEKYYVSMAAAWLIAEVVVKDFESGTAFLQRNTLSARTHNRIIRKACESLRLDATRKGELKSLKRKE